MQGFDVRCNVPGIVLDARLLSGFESVGPGISRLFSRLQPLLNQTLSPRRPQERRVRRTGRRQS